MSAVAQNQSIFVWLNSRWVSALILLQEELLCTRALPAEKLTVWPNCSLYTETRKAKWIQFGWQSLSEELHLSEHGGQVNTFWLAMLTWSAIFKWKQPYAAQFGMQTLLNFFYIWCIYVEKGRPSEYNLPSIVWFKYLIWPLNWMAWSNFFALYLSLRWWKMNLEQMQN